ncbi:B30.2/SPRY domain-containing protein [Entamoeba marina]
MQHCKLEMFYMIQVTLHMCTYEELLDFIQVSSTCKSAVEALKVNPHFTNQESIYKFFQHFNPETVSCYLLDYYDKEVFTKAKCIKSPNFSNHLENKEEIEGYLDKITNLDLSNATNLSKTNSLKFFVENATKFTRLRKVEGDIDFIVKFFKQFTENGKHKQVNFPKRIIIDSTGGYAITLDQKVFNSIKKLKKYLPDLDTIYVALLVYSHPSSFSDENRRELYGIHYFYRILSRNQSQIMENSFCNFDGSIFMDSFVNGTRFNNLIEKGCVVECIIRYVREKKLDDNWTIPDTIKHLDIKESNMRNMVWIGSKDIKLPINFNNATKLSLSSCQLLEIDLSKNLQTVILDKCTDVVINLENCHLNRLVIEKGLRVGVKGDLSYINNLQIIRSDSCVLPFISFENKVVVIEDCRNLFFGDKTIDPLSGTNNLTIEDGSFDSDIDSESESEDENENDEVEMKQSPLDFLNISVEDFKLLTTDCLRYPPDVDYDVLLKQRNLFKMRKFNTKSNKISINGNVIKRIAERDGTCDLIVSSNFYVATDNKKYKDPTNPNQLIPADIRYYEIQVNTFCIISMGIIDTHQYGYSPNNQIGWRPYSIGFHSDDGALFRKGYSTISRYGKAYGSIVGETNVVGCGYNKRKQTYGKATDKHQFLLLQHYHPVTALINSLQLNDSEEVLHILQTYLKDCINNSFTSDVDDFFLSGMHSILHEIIFIPTTTTWQQCREVALSIIAHYSSLENCSNEFCNNYTISRIFQLLHDDQLFTVVTSLLYSLLNKSNHIFPLSSIDSVEDILQPLTVLQLARFIPVLTCLIDTNSQTSDDNVKILFGSKVLDKIVPDPSITPFLQLSHTQINVYPNISLTLTDEPEETSYALKTLTDVLYIVNGFVESSSSEKVCNFMKASRFDVVLVNVFHQFNFCELPTYTPNSNHPLLGFIHQFCQFLIVLSRHDIDLFFSSDELHNNYGGKRGLFTLFSKSLSDPRIPQSYKTLLFSKKHLHLIPFCLDIISKHPFTDISRHGYDILSSLIRNNEENINFMCNLCSTHDLLNDVEKSPVESNIFFQTLLTSKTKPSSLENEVKSFSLQMFLNCAFVFNRLGFSSVTFSCLNTLLVILLKQLNLSTFLEDAIASAKSDFVGDFVEFLKSLTNHWLECHDDASNLKSFQYLYKSTSIPEDCFVNIARFVCNL